MVMPPLNCCHYIKLRLHFCAPVPEIHGRLKTIKTAAFSRWSLNLQKAQYCKQDIPNTFVYSCLGYVLKIPAQSLVYTFSPPLRTK